MNAVRTGLRRNPVERMWRNNGIEELGESCSLEHRPDEPGREVRHDGHGRFGSVQCLKGLERTLEEADRSGTFGDLRRQTRLLDAIFVGQLNDVGSRSEAVLELLRQIAGQPRQNLREPRTTVPERAVYPADRGAFWG